MDSQTLSRLTLAAGGVLSLAGVVLAAGRAVRDRDAGLAAAAYRAGADARRDGHELHELHG